MFTGNLTIGGAKSGMYIQGITWLLIWPYYRWIYVHNSYSRWTDKKDGGNLEPWHGLPPRLRV